jgi:hypothetical protein
MPRSEPASSAPRAEQLRVRLSALEAERIDARAREAGARFSDYARHALICGQIVTRERARLPFAVRRELERIGVNLRQLWAWDGPEALCEEVRAVHGRVAAILRAEITALRSTQDEELQSEARRDVMRAVRLSGDQRAVIEALAHKSGRSLSSYAREMLSEGQVTVTSDREIAYAELEALKGLGAALNTVTRQANIDKRLPRGLADLLMQLGPHLDRLARG